MDRDCARTYRRASTEKTALQREGFEELFRRSYPRLVKTLCFITLDPELAADSAQEAFFQLHLHWDRISQYEDPVGWVYRIAVSRCTDHRRRLARLGRLVERLAGQQQQRDEVIWYPERAFMEALKGLPERQRVAAALHYVAGLSQQETATAMHISEGAIKSHLSRARDKLQNKLEVES